MRKVPKIHIGPSRVKTRTIPKGRDRPNYFCTSGLSSCSHGVRFEPISDEDKRDFGSCEKAIGGGNECDTQTDLSRFTPCVDSNPNVRKRVHAPPSDCQKPPHSRYGRDPRTSLNELAVFSRGLVRPCTRRSPKLANRGRRTWLHGWFRVENAERMRTCWG